MALYEEYLSAFPVGSRINIGYPSICGGEYSKCQDIVGLKRNAGVELSTVGHARKHDLNIMAKLLREAENVSANIWISSSTSACTSILHSSPEDVLNFALNSIKYWRELIDIPLDIALTDVTNDAIDNPESRVVEWYGKLMGAGYRSVILCDTKGIGNMDRLRRIFENIGTFEWHPHNDLGLAKVTTSLAVEYGASHVGTSFLNCSERKNMMDPRDVIHDKAYVKLLNNIVEGFPDEVKKILEVRDIVYGDHTFITGTHYKLWNNSSDKNRLLFGVTTDSQLFEMMYGQNISASEMASLKNQLLYSGNEYYLTQERLETLKQLFTRQ
nr:hypothetical protein [Fulvivirga marina]